MFNREIIDVCSENRTKRIDAMCEQHVKTQNDKTDNQLLVWLALEDEADRLSRNVGNKLQVCAA